jgi:hypothetical protein
LAPEQFCELIARDAHVVDAEFFKVSATREEVGDAVGGVGEPLREPGEEG